ncbi:Iroquois-class homeodomain protein IRX-6 [Trichinella nativa]|uniref:Iroquois-class homeodomain protein IRX-6 n=1 Tax=Trichinella nativa TaxID=6335 RepID=A0A0V1L1D1_9BILA|nr:Iroquois-class homeodomain protein IRX-6 [Trichinella nativa]
MMPKAEQHLAEPCSSSLLALYKTLPCWCVLGACFPPSIVLLFSPSERGVKIAAKEYISKRNACPVLTSRRFCSRLAVSIAAQTERRPTMFDVDVVCFQPRHYLNNDLAVSLNLLQAFRPRTD